MFELKVNDDSLQKAFNKLITSAERPGEALNTIARYLRNVTEDSFQDERSPFGDAWKPVARDGKILQKSGQLAASIHTEVGSDYVVLGSGKVYAAIHQFGGETKPHVILPRYKKALAFGGRVVKKVNHPGSKIPSRAFMPIDAQGNIPAKVSSDLESIVSNFLRNSIK